MKPNLRLACVLAVCVLLFAGPVAGQRTNAPAAREPDQGVTPSETSRITGTIKDPTGAVVPGARVELTNPSSGFEAATATDRLGRFSFFDVSAGTYRLRASAPGFDADVVPALVVTGSREIAV